MAIQKHFHRDLEQIHQRLLAVSAIVEQMIDKASRALLEQTPELAQEVIDSDEQVNQAEVLIEEECLKILALHQPVATDLRRIATVMKINAELERIGDLACNIAKRALSLQGHPFFPMPDALPVMFQTARQMVNKALDSFVKSDSELARQVIKMDDQVDDQIRDIIGELIALMRQDPGLVQPAMHCFSAAGHIERIGDQAENIAEDVIYLIDGDIVRHMHGAFPETTSESVSQDDDQNR